jgi:peptide-methionine (S)-S-oxide reductase
MIKIIVLVTVLLGIILLIFLVQRPAKNMSQTKQPSNISLEGKEVATLGGGCFWCVEAVFDDLRGVESVESGYSGGSVDNPSYRDDPKVVSFKEILEVFFTVHDPTTLNRQGADVGTQYRSAIFYHSPEQKTVSEQVIKETASKIWDDPIVTEVSPFKQFYVAEDYHQEYYKDNSAQPYCQFVIAPKVKKFRQQFKEKLKR